jgi:hypothetical protein
MNEVNYDKNVHDLPLYVYSFLFLPLIICLLMIFVMQSEKNAIEECERIHGICNEMKQLLDASTKAYAEKSAECER